ncbi:MAG: hypothetical protein LBE12_00500 [Planctomycetaceae bacterium]|jgi:hypothetical protein|nr:hypothetical protein [Planctomycetaceae bacterium]
MKLLIGIKLFFYFFVISVLVAVSGCASFGERQLKIRNYFEQGRIETAQKELDKSLKKKRRSEIDLLKLNQSIVKLCSGNPREAEKLLREVRNSFDENERERAINIAEKAVSMLADDNAVSYAGEDYEKVLIRVFLALSNLMYDGTDAPAYALQIGQKQNEIIQNGTVKDPNNEHKTLNLKAESYRQVAIGPYLIGAMQEETLRNYDDVTKAYATVCNWEPDFVQGQRDLERARTGFHSAPGHGVVYVFGLVGAGPYKLQQNCEVLQAAQFWITLSLAMSSQRPIIPDFAPVMIPVVVRPYEVVPSLTVSIDGKWSAQTETLTDIGRMAEEQFEAVKPQIIARAVIRRSLKKGIMYGSKEMMDANPWISLAMELGGFLWETLETADTRCWNLLPAEIQAARIEVPAGKHRLSLQSSGQVFSLSADGYRRSPSSTRLGKEHSRTIQVDAGRNTYVLANFPTNNLIGQIVVSNENDDNNDNENENSSPE